MQGVLPTDVPQNSKPSSVPFLLEATMLHLLHFLVSQYDLATIIPAPSPTAVSSATATAAGAVAANTDESGAEYNVNKRCEIAENYNLHDADEQQGGAALHSIIAQVQA